MARNSPSRTSTRHGHAAAPDKFVARLGAVTFAGATWHAVKTNIMTKATTKTSQPENVWKKPSAASGP